MRAACSASPGVSFLARPGPVTRVRARRASAGSTITQLSRSLITGRARVGQGRHLGVGQRLLVGPAAQGQPPVEGEERVGAEEALHELALARPASDLDPAGRAEVLTQAARPEDVDACLGQRAEPVVEQVDQLLGLEDEPVGHGLAQQPLQHRPGGGRPAQGPAEGEPRPRGEPVGGRTGPPQQLGVGEVGVVVEVVGLRHDHHAATDEHLLGRLDAQGEPHLRRRPRSPGGSALRATRLEGSPRPATAGDPGGRVIVSATASMSCTISSRARSASVSPWARAGRGRRPARCSSGSSGPTRQDSPEASSRIRPAATSRIAIRVAPPSSVTEGCASSARSARVSTGMAPRIGIRSVRRWSVNSISLSRGGVRGTQVAGPWRGTKLTRGNLARRPDRPWSASASPRSRGRPWPPPWAPCRRRRSG